MSEQMLRGYSPDVHEPGETVGSQLAYLGDLIQRTNVRFTELMQRLDQILIPVADEAKVASEPSAIRRTACELSNTIDDLNKQLDRLQRRISEATERVQL